MSRLWIGVAVVVTVLALGVAGCVGTVLPNVKPSAPAPGGLPPVLGDPPVTTPEAWAARRRDLLAAFDAHVYGPPPPDRVPREIARTVIEADAFGGLGRIEVATLDLGPPGAEVLFDVAYALPNSAGPHPLVILQLFCGNRAALRDDPRIPAPRSLSGGGCDGDSILTPVMYWVFGQHIVSPPIERLLGAGYALAFTYAGDVVPDSAERAPAALARLAGPGETAPSGAISAWAWTYSQTAAHAATDPRIDAGRIALFGHSRNGKAALLAGARDPAIALVIAHQSGTGGASLSRKSVGESIAEMTESYPHWFDPAYAAWAGREATLPIDQHQLIAAMAPRPLLLGGSRRDAWSDPIGGFRAAEAATPAYRLFGSGGLTQPAADAFDPEADIASTLRVGLHGVRVADWDAFIAFLDAHFQK